VIGKDHDRMGDRGNERLNLAFRVLSDPCRRAVVDALAAEGSADVDELAERVSAGLGWPERLVQTALVHQHLPKLEAAGVVSFDADEGRVEREDLRLVRSVLCSARTAVDGSC